MQEHFVNIANVSLENFPYVLDLKVTYHWVKSVKYRVISRPYSVGIQENTDQK